MTTQAMIEQIDARLRRLSPEDIQVILQLVQRIKVSKTSHQLTKQAKYNFSKLPGKWTWQGNALDIQRQLRDEW
jgi:hypothetical protein